MYCGVYCLCRSEMYDNNNIKGLGGKDEYTDLRFSHFTSEVI